MFIVINAGRFLLLLLSQELFCKYYVLQRLWTFGNLYAQNRYEKFGNSGVQWSAACICGNCSFSFSGWVARLCSHLVVGHCWHLSFSSFWPSFVLKAFYPYDKKLRSPSLQSVPFTFHKGFIPKLFGQYACLWEEMHQSADNRDSMPLAVVVASFCRRKKSILFLMQLVPGALRRVPGDAVPTDSFTAKAAQLPKLPNEGTTSVLLLKFLVVGC